MKSNYKIISLLVFLIVVILISCAAFTKYGKLESKARKYYEARDYDRAVFTVSDALRIKPEYDKAQQLIQTAFKTAVNIHTDKIEELKKSTNKFKWDDIVEEYNALIKLNKAVEELPPLTDKETEQIIEFEIIHYSSNLDEAKKNSAEAHYKQGVRLAASSDKVDIQKAAAKEFKIATSMVPGYKDAESLYAKSRKAGIKRIAIIPFEDKSGKAGQYGSIADKIVDDIVSNIMNDPSSMEFLEIISRDQLQRVMQEQQLGLSGIIDQQTAVEIGRVLGVHEILTGKITQIIYTPSRTINKTFKETAEVVVGEKKYIDDKGKERTKQVWGKVTARVTTYTKTSGASISGSYNFIEVKTAKLKKSKSFVGKSDFKAQWATFQGDERALSNGSKSLASRNEQLAPVEAAMVDSATNNLVDNLVAALKTYVQ